MPLYGGIPKECPFCGHSVISDNKLSAGIAHRFICIINPEEHHGYYSNSKDETENIKDDEKLSDSEMKRLIEYALIGWGKNPTFSITDSNLMDKIRKWKTF